MSKKQGFLFWITGFSGSGKTEIAKNVYKFIKKNMGPTILVNGDDLRNIFKLNDYSKNGRLQNSRKFTKLAKFITILLLYGAPARRNPGTVKSLLGI